MHGNALALLGSPLPPSPPCFTQDDFSEFVERLPGRETEEIGEWADAAGMYAVTCVPVPVPVSVFCLSVQACIAFPNNQCANAMSAGPSSFVLALFPFPPFDSTRNGPKRGQMHGMKSSLSFASLTRTQSLLATSSSSLLPSCSSAKGLCC